MRLICEKDHQKPRLNGKDGVPGSARFPPTQSKRAVDRPPADVLPAAARRGLPKKRSQRGYFETSAPKYCLEIRW